MRCCEITETIITQEGWPNSISNRYTGWYTPFLLLMSQYRVTLVVEYLGWVDLDLGCSTILLGQYVATVAAHQPGELPKSKSTNLGIQPPKSPCIASLYSVAHPIVRHIVFGFPS